MRRFVSDEILKANRQKIRFGTRCVEMLLDGAVDALSQASELHCLLEKIYTSAMDFEQFETMTNEWVGNIFEKE